MKQKHWALVTATVALAKASSHQEKVPGSCILDLLSESQFSFVQGPFSDVHRIGLESFQHFQPPTN